MSNPGEFFEGIDMIDLYTWTTPNGEKPIIMLEEVGLPYTLHLVDIGAGVQKQPEFLAINPNGRIPAITDGGQRVFESGAILVHLAEKTGQLLPAEAAERAETFAWMFFQAGGTGPMIGQWHHFKSAAPEKLPYAIERYRNETRRLLGVLDVTLKERDFLAGSYSIADVMNFSWAKAGLKELDATSEFPALAAWIARIAARPPVVAALEKLSAAKKALG